MSKLTHRRRSAVLAGLGAAAALSLLAACGGSDGDGGTASKDKGVVSINSPSASGTSASASAAAESGRPQLRVDSTDEERTRLYQVWTNCLHDHGVPAGHKPGSTEWSLSASTDKYPAALSACLSKRPIEPPEEDPAKNPHYMDDFRTYIRCLNDGGLKVKGLSDGSGWNYDGEPTLTQDQQDKLDHDCEVKAYK
ncbi:hypothetical protein R6V09_33050 [Streptomyces sp. W16]|uniref:hypothetical protein n=1 Tax=Streptomyces sp. W16 TaxID=3076631 RepID=UPI00295B5841|nr:hypothetical protein [Streptomyces sp. W16]MDV9174927.1 hypothetical protein [Streptomyces sp. W16]